jgi:hypothetical protein
MELFTQRHASKIQGVLSCFDRVVITGTIPGICYAAGMTSFLKASGIRIFDYPKWAEPLREEIRTNAERLAQENGLEIEFIRRNNFRKEKRIKEIIATRGDHPGLVHIFSAMEPCPSYKPWHDKKSHRTFLKPKDAKCLHYYFYFIDPDLGLCYLRVPTWAPFRLQFSYNGHYQLACELQREGIGHKMLENAFVELEHWNGAQALADSIDSATVHRKLNEVAAMFCPVICHFSAGYHWSLMQVEYATDILFHRQKDLKAIYEELVRTAVHSVKPENVATFLGRKLTGQYQDEMGNNFHTRIQGTRLKHHMGKVAIKMYDKHGIILRIETVANDVSFFKHHRKVEHRDGTWTMKTASMKKSIYSLLPLMGLMWASNQRYLKFISSIDDPTMALKDLEKISKPARDSLRTYRGFNLFHGNDLDLFLILVRGEFNISGFHNANIRFHLPGKTSQQVCRLIKRLRKHGLIRKIRNTYKYYLTSLGRRIILTALKLREMFIIPYLRGSLST